ncbi:hypothetical protein H8788_02510 [Parabacteroides faecis]|uniref:fimbrial protein n=1 Tax=Parabacteroides TaxID=375288 RepID=UPI000EFDEE4F|nr:MULTISPECIES: fimbrial protein [Parabacteroides]MBC8616596.1 hypothetical protein [Parabacteroides faecis]RHR92644.1 hypothetical protein DWW23_23630 [Parabacteroides sp. AF14-59]
MKLKHLFLTALVVGSLASCSKDDDGPNEPVYQKIDTYLTISATSNNGIIMKSVVDEGPDEDGKQLLENESFINKLTAYVFYNEGEKKLAAKETAWAKDNKSVDRIEDVIVKVDATEAGAISKTSLIVVLLANVDLAEEPASYSDLEKGIIFGIDKYSVEGLASTGLSYLPMSSKVIEIGANTLAAGTAYDNWITLDNSKTKVINTTQKDKNTDALPILIPNNGSVKDVTSNSDLTVSKIGENAKITLTRYVARVQLEGLDCNFTGNYENATFTVKTVSIANASNSSKLFGEGNFALQNVLGKTDVTGVYDQVDAFFRGYPTTIDRVDYYLAAGTQKDVLKKEYENGLVIKKGTSVLFKGAENAGEGAPEMARFYVFEFQKFAIGQDSEAKEGDKLGTNSTKEIYTTLIITGEWENGAIKGIRNFRIPIKSTDGAEGEGVMRNNVYKVSATLTGEGTDNPDKNMLNACLSFSIKVLPWNVIKQEEDDIN